MHQTGGETVRFRKKSYTSRLPHSCEDGETAGVEESEQYRMDRSVLPGSGGGE